MNDKPTGQKEREDKKAHVTILSPPPFFSLIFFFGTPYRFPVWNMLRHGFDPPGDGKSFVPVGTWDSWGMKQNTTDFIY